MDSLQIFKWQVLAVALFLVPIWGYSHFQGDAKPVKKTSSVSTQVAQNKYTNGYLKSNATWADEVSDIGTSRVHSNSKPVRIEIWNLDIVMANGQNNRSIVMIYFLEGKYQGRWGYTLRAYTKI